MFIGTISQCVYYICYVGIGVLNIFGKEVPDESGIGGEEMDSGKAYLANVNEEAE